MKILADTHILIWMLMDTNLSEKARELLGDPNNQIYYSIISIWEIELKKSVHPDKMPFSAKEFGEGCFRSGFIPLRGKPEHVYMIETLRKLPDPSVHKDPFDRLLIAQAKQEGMLFVTHDSLIPLYGEDFIVSV